MTDVIDLRSSAFLDNALDVLNRVSWQLNNNRQAASEAVNLTMAKLSLIGEARLEELRDAQYELDCADEDDSGYCESERRDEALEAVQKYRSVFAQVEAAGRGLVAKAEALSQRGQQLTSGGVATLQRRIEARNAYMAIQMPTASGGVAAGQQAVMANANITVTNKPAPTSAAETSHLPAGFGWINIDEVDAAGFIDDPAEFKKADYASMTRGLEILRDEIIPALHKGAFTRTDAERFDRERGTDYTEEGWVHQESRLTVWQAFLDPRREADVVAVERGPDGKLCVSSGRHRLGLARKLGIKMVPVRILGQQNGH